MIQTIRKAWAIPELRKKLVFTALILLIFRFHVIKPLKQITQAAKEYAAGVNFNSGIDLYDCVETNENFFIGKGLPM